MAWAEKEQAAEVCDEFCRALKGLVVREPTTMEKIKMRISEILGVTKEQVYNELATTKLNVYELSNFQAAQVLESVKEKVVEEPSHIEQLKLKMSEQWGFTKEQVYKILWINYHAP